MLVLGCDQGVPTRGPRGPRRDPTLNVSSSASFSISPFFVCRSIKPDAPSLAPALLSNT